MSPEGPSTVGHSPSASEGSSLLRSGLVALALLTDSFEREGDLPIPTTETPGDSDHPLERTVFHNPHCPATLRGYSKILSSH